MADKVIISKSKLVALGDVIREKTGSSGKMTVDVMTETMRNHSGGSTGSAIPNIPYNNPDFPNLYHGMYVGDKTSLMVDNAKLAQFLFDNNIISPTDIVPSGSQWTGFEIVMRFVFLGNLSGIFDKTFYDYSTIAAGEGYVYYVGGNGDDLYGFEVNGGRETYQELFERIVTVEPISTITIENIYSLMIEHIPTPINGKLDLGIAAFATSNGNSVYNVINFNEIQPDFMWFE